MTIDPLLIVVVGPTGSGKTALSLRLAESLRGEVVSCDSVAVYRDMELGTAKPTREERARVPHHMIDVVPPSVEYTAGDYGRAARVAVRDIAARGKAPIVAGGTGLYLRALLDGFSPVPKRDEALRERLRAAMQRRSPLILWRILRRLDASAAKRIHANDHPKLIRAIEISLLTGSPLTAAWQANEPLSLPGFRTVQIGLAPDRTALYERINERCATMFHDGLVEETRALLAVYGEGCRALQSLGYAEAQAVLRGELTQAEAIAKAQTGHRNYSKRQGTWFRRDPRIHWLHNFGDMSFEQTLQLIETTDAAATSPCAERLDGSQTRR